MGKSEASIRTLKIKYEIKESPARVWSALTDNIGAWWPDDFYAGGIAGEREFALEPQPGGRMFEQWHGGGGVLWGTVVAVEPGARLQVLGALFPNWGGPNQSYMTWELRTSDSGTLLRFSESSVGRTSKGAHREKKHAWRFLWQCLAAYVEGVEPPPWEP